MYSRRKHRALGKTKRPCESWTGLNQRSSLTGKKEEKSRNAQKLIYESSKQITSCRWDFVETVLDRKKSKTSKAGYSKGIVGDHEKAPERVVLRWVEPDTFGYLNGKKETEKIEDNSYTIRDEKRKIVQVEEDSCRSNQSRKSKQVYVETSLCRNRMKSKLDEIERIYIRKNNK